MTVVESMAAGAVPVVYKAGGHKEIVEDGVDGYLWESVDELFEKTIALIKKERVEKEVKSAITKSRKFSYEKFENKIKDLL